MDAHPLLEVLVADVLATMVIFACSVAFGNSSFYDPYWSVAPPLIAACFLGSAGSADPGRQIIVMLVVVLWSIRLTANWAYGWRGLGHQDWRYEMLAERSGVLWWPLSFAGVHLFPTLVVLAGCLPLYPALTVGDQPLGTLDAIAAALGLASIWLELEADRALHRFRSRRASRAEVLHTGVWAWCRHPNYLGEIGFWVSLFLFGIAAWGGIYPGSWLGPACMLALFVLVSIPMIERKLEADKPGYGEYRRQTRMLVPGVF
ncbi:MAG: DUF1295 domain-containing protein [Pseudomonadales bacterium]|jgi:steroid 5-alpha reductase family enzyme